MAPSRAGTQTLTGGMLGGRRATYQDMMHDDRSKGRYRDPRLMRCIPYILRLLCQGTMTKGAPARWHGYPLPWDDKFEVLDIISSRKVICWSIGGTVALGDTADVKCQWRLALWERPAPK